MLDSYGVHLRMLRLDQLHPQVSGNKWFKLRLNLQAAREQGYTRLLSFGGAYSNHLYAMAAAAKLFDFEAVAVIRGELVEPLNSTLQFLQDQGVVLHSVSRSDYRRRYNEDYLRALLRQYPGSYVIPEGGSNALGVRGCMDIPQSFQWQQETLPRKRIVAVACGTGATLAGLVAAQEGDYRVLGFSALKGGQFLQQDVLKHIEAAGEQEHHDWRIDFEAHGRGYGKSDSDLERFIDDFAHRNEVLLDQVYTAKMMRRLYALIKQGQIEVGSEIIAIHTGGLREMW
ncbi:MAG: pyridoxal-phosphate dependent enzyme [Pseudohongiellaceae bacterium]|nr:pyridoxal-phosphate dependent enzyme [Pseudohongiellaceae bacterium]